MINYIFMPDKIFEVSLNDYPSIQQRMSIRKMVEATDISDKTKHYKALIEYFDAVEMLETPDKKIPYAIFLHFKQLYKTNRLNNSDKFPIKMEIFPSLFLSPPSLMELQNQLISLLYSVFRIKPDINFTIEDLIVSTGYTQTDLQKALPYFKKIGIIKKIPRVDNLNQRIEENFLDERYAVERKIIEEYEKIESIPAKISTANKFFRRITIGPKSEFCFVIMPFKDEEFPQKWYKEFLKPFIEQEFNIECLRVDDDMLPYKIDDKIYTYILEAKFVLAEISTLNPNVMYELGMAHILNKDVILLTKEDSKKIPFDVDKIPVFKYEDEENLKDRLRKAIPGLMQQ